MTDPFTLLGASVTFLVLLVLVLQFFMLQKVNKLDDSNTEQVKIELIRLLEHSQETLKDGLNNTRKELREVSSDNRREMNDLFKDFQDTLLKRVTENSSEQSRQLDSFRSALNGLSEKLINNSNDFKQSVSSSFQASSEALNKKQDEFREKTLEKLNDFDDSIKKDAKENREELNTGLKSFEQRFAQSIKEFDEQLRVKFADLTKQQQEANLLAKSSINEIRETIERQLQSIRQDNNQQLNEMRKTVDEKLHETLEKRLGESFKLVSDRLEQVHKGLGEMQTLAVGVGDLKKVLANVKTRGILGEYQLGNILEQILAPEQYDVNVATKKGSQANV
ncbi:MAG: DNA recombination protein RmuC, partial [Methyloprofundus sp.]|nr:DNA recombination protein RmuC [Methyloprofundus sp.]